MLTHRRPTSIQNCTARPLAYNNRKRDLSSVLRWSLCVVMETRHQRLLGIFRTLNEANNLKHLRDGGQRYSI